MVAVAATQERLLIPNSHQIPNLYSDRYMAFLTSEEWKVLTYTARRMFGFNKRSDRISLSQYTSGTKSSKGEHLDYGTGLSLSAVRKALKSLVDFGLISAAENNKQNEGTLYSLELDEQKIQLEALQKRHEELTKANTQKSEKARQAATAKRKGSLSDRPLLSDSSLSVGQTPRGTVGQKHNIQGNPENTQRIHFCETADRGSPDTAPSESKSQPEPEPCLDSLVLGEKDNIPPAAPEFEPAPHEPLLPEVSTDYKAAWTCEARRVGLTLGSQYTRHYIPEKGKTTLCHKTSFEYHPSNWTYPGYHYPDEQCPTCAAKLAERQAKAAARAEKAKEREAAKKPSAYSSNDLFDAIAAVYDATDAADKKAIGWKVGKIRAALVDWALAKTKVPDLTDEQIKRLVERLKGFPGWYRKECEGCDLPGDKKFMDWWMKYAATFTNGEGAARNKRPWFETLKGLWFEIRDGVTYAKRPSDEFWAVYNGG